LKKLFLFLIDFYKKAVSPYLPAACRFSPTCSQYAKEAIERFGVIRGLMLSVWRILRCNPFNKHCGFDPVPEKFGFGRKK